MQTVYARLVLCGALVTAAVPLLAQQKAPAGKPADEKVPAARIGEPAPDFSLLDSEGTKHTLSGFKDKLVVLEWVNQQCPFSVAAVPVMKDLQKKYHDKGIVWLGIESTHWRTPEENARYIKEKSLGFPILMDNDGRGGRLYGAKVTPHISSSTRARSCTPERCRLSRRVSRNPNRRTRSCATTSTRRCRHSGQQAGAAGRDYTAWLHCEVQACRGEKEPAAAGEKKE
jgi:peroxiredoxin